MYLHGGIPPYSPDLAPADFYLFHPLQSALKGRCFCDATDTIKNAMGEMKRLSQNGFQDCFQHLYSRCQKCIVKTRGIVWRKSSLNDYTVLYFAEIKWFRGNILKLPRVSRTTSWTPLRWTEMARHQDMQKIQINGPFFENRLHWQFEVEKNF